MKPIITLLSDFGTEDGYVGAMKGRILSICSKAKLVDISHNIPKFNIRSAAFALCNYFDYYPRGTIHVVVVDPGVGSDRKPIIIEMEGSYIIAPDNGVVSLLTRQREFKVYHITTDWVDWELSPTFHGRDLFGPAGAKLACGANISEMAEESLHPVKTFFLPVKKIGSHTFKLHVLHIDHFGNIITNLHLNDFIDYLSVMKSARLLLGKVFLYGLKKTYSDVNKGECLMLWGSSGFLEIAQNQGNASVFFNVKKGDELTLELP